MLARTGLILTLGALALGLGSPAAAQHEHGHMTATADTAAAHAMFMHPLGQGWQLMGMAQLYPLYTAGFGSELAPPLDSGEFYVTQPAVMFDVTGPGSRIVLRVTANLEGLTQPDGEITPGAWGEGFIDRRHPHTFLHEAMLSLNFHELLGGHASLSAGKGFAPYGTDDPMSRPAVKYPTNHHLSQVLERYTIIGAYLRGGWSLEGGAFAGSEPDGPWDMGNYRGFPDSWSARLIRRFGGTGTHAPLELGASYASITEPHGHDAPDRHTELLNAYLRHEHATPIGSMYALIEASRADPDYSDDWWSLLGELQLEHGASAPYARLEISTRPEFARRGASGRDFFRYDHDALPTGATRWLIATLGYDHTLRGYPWGARLFAEGQFNNVSVERGDLLASELFGTNDFFTLSAGLRIMLGGDRMRMGSYGVLDDMISGMMGSTMDGMRGMEHRH